MSVSVIIPMYNAGKTIEKCVRSVAGQAVDEILAVDDGSSDNTVRITEELSCVNLRVIQQLHAGASEARNRGIREAKGDWLIFLDADDSLLPASVQSLARAANEQTDACCGGIVRGKDEAPEETGYTGKISDRHRLMNHVLADPTNLLTIHGWMFRRSVCIEKGIYFDPALRLGEDSEFVLRYLSACRAVSFIPAPVYHYSISEASTIHIWKPGQTDAYAKTLSVIEKTPVSAEKNWPLFVLTTLLLILTHDTFHPMNPANRKERIKRCKTLRETTMFREAFRSADLSCMSFGKRAVLKCYDYRLYPIVLLAVKYRQRQNAFRSRKE